MRRPKNRPAPAAIVAEVDHSSEYELARVEWARRLSETNLRSLTADYLQGRRDECTTDAYNEFERRKSLGLLGMNKSPGKSLKQPKSRKGNRSRK